MKKFFTIIALAAAFIPAAQGMNYSSARFTSNTPRKKNFMCSECDTAFFSEKNLDAHKTYSYCGKKTAEKALNANENEKALVEKIENEQPK